MKKLILSLLLMVFISTLIAYGSEQAPLIDKNEAIEILKAGNERFVSDKRTMGHLTAERMKEVATKGQKPYVTILSCSDSRVPVEHIFDAGIGDLFVIRVAGNVCNTDEIATIEYGTEHLGTPLLVILGHTKCGAVTAMAEGAKLEGSLPELLACIKPEVEKVKTKNPELKGQELVCECVKENIWCGIECILKKSHIARELVKSGKLMIVGAIYDLDTGKVEWLGQHPNEAKLLEKSGENTEGEKGEKTE